MKDTIIQIACLVIAYVLYPFLIMRNGFDWTAAILGAELILVTVTGVPDIVKRCKK